MRTLIALCSLVACAVAKPGIGAPLAYSAVGPLGYPLGLGYAGHLGVPNALGYSALAAPAAVAYAAAPAIAAGVRTQYHAQDELGQAAYGHSEPFQTHNAVQDVYGNKIGSYSYVAPDGQVVKADYVADGAGYRVASNALPVGPTALPVGPAPVQDTPEVVAARAAHLAELEAAKHRSKRGIAVGHTPASTALAAPLAPVVAPALAYTSALPYGAALPYTSALPYGYGAPAVRAATLTTVVNNPGHAVSYRVD